MKVITFYSDSHSTIYNDYFLESFNKYLSHHKLISKKIEQISATGEYESPGFDKVMLEKINLIIENIDLSDDEPFVYADCDVQFFGDLEFEFGDNDILFQNDYFPNNHCAGFFIAKQNQKVLEFFQTVKERFIKLMDGKIHDQTVIYYLFLEGYDGIKKDMLPNDKYWTVAFSTGGKPWDGQIIKVPNSLIVHHANFTVGIKNKLLLLEEVKKIKNNIWHTV
jgi:hypothetical protein